MSISVCKECFNDISSSKKQCPYCSKPNPHYSHPLTYPGLGLIACTIIGTLMYSCVSQDAETPQQQRPATQEEKRTYEIRKAFNKWDGSHFELEKYIKKRLKDPDSYQHIKTTYLDKDTYIVVTTKFRSKNSFGGYVVNTAAARTTLGGELIEAEIFTD